MSLQVGRDFAILLLAIIFIGWIGGKLTSVDLQAIANRAVDVVPSTAPRGGACRAADALDVCRAAFLSAGGRGR